MAECQQLSIQKISKDTLGYIELEYSMQSAGLSNGAEVACYFQPFVVYEDRWDLLHTDFITGAVGSMEPGNDKLMIMKLIAPFSKISLNDIGLMYMIRMKYPDGRESDSFHKVMPLNIFDHEEKPVELAHRFNVLRNINPSAIAQSE